MSLVTVAELQTFMGTTLVSAQAQAALDIAEQQVAVVLGMVESDGLGLNRRTGVVREFWVTVGASALEVPTGPLEAITACSLDGVAQVVGAGGIEIRTPWTIRWDPPTGLEFSKGQRVELTASIGYIASGSPGVVIPPPVKNAVLIQASGVYSNLDSLASGQVIASERIGDYAVSYQSSTAGVASTSPVLPSLLQPIRRTPFLGA